VQIVFFVDQFAAVEVGQLWLWWRVGNKFSPSNVTSSGEVWLCSGGLFICRSACTSCYSFDTDFWNARYVRCTLITVVTNALPCDAIWSVMSVLGVDEILHCIADSCWFMFRIFHDMVWPLSPLCYMIICCTECRCVPLFYCQLFDSLLSVLAMSLHYSEHKLL